MACANHNPHAGAGIIRHGGKEVEPKMPQTQAMIEDVLTDLTEAHMDLEALIECSGDLGEAAKAALRPVADTIRANTLRLENYLIVYVSAVWMLRHGTTTTSKEIRRRARDVAALQVEHEKRTLGSRNTERPEREGLTKAA